MNKSEEANVNVIDMIPVCNFVFNVEGLEGVIGIEMLTNNAYGSGQGRWEVDVYVNEKNLEFIKNSKSKVLKCGDKECVKGELVIYLDSLKSKNVKFPLSLNLISWKIHDLNYYCDDKMTMGLTFDVIHESYL